MVRAKKRKPKPHAPGSGRSGGFGGWTPQGGLPSYNNPGAVGETVRGQGAPVGEAPPDAGLLAAQAQTGRLTGYADAQATFDTGRINRDYGYDAQGGVDPNNPYSKAALLERSREQATRGTTNSMAAQGQLYSGATQNAQNANTFGYLSASNSLKNQYGDALNQTTLNQTGAYANAGANLSPEMLAALKRALGQG